jgi:hypothetical protein
MAHHAEGELNISDLQRGALVLFAAREAGPNADLKHMKAIAYVIRNRVRAGWAENWLAAMEQAEVNRANDLVRYPLNINSRAFQMFTRDIDEIFYGSNQDNDEIAAVCCGATKEEAPLMYWCYIGRPISQWFTENILRKPEEHRQRANFNLLYLYE